MEYTLIVQDGDKVMDTYELTLYEFNKAKEMHHRLKQKKERM